MWLGFIDAVLLNHRTERGLGYVRYLALAFVVGVLVTSAESSSQPQALAQGLPHVVRCVKPAVVFVSTARIDGKTVSGSGFIISKDGYLLTAYHVVEKARRIFVRLPSGHGEEARFVKGNEVLDFALLKLTQGLNYPRVTLLGGSAPSQGEEILVFGYPGGRYLGVRDVTVTRGIISAFRGFQNNIIQIDASINPGNSGGPVVGLDSLVVGIAFASSPRMIGVNFAVSMTGPKVMLIFHGLNPEGSRNARVRSWTRDPHYLQLSGPPPCD